MRRRKTVDADMIMSFRPCDAWPEGRVREAVPKRVSLIKFLGLKHIPPEDRLWVALHKELLDDRTMRLFGCDCAERVLIRERDRGHDPDARLWRAVEVSRSYAVGEATDEELSAAWAAAWAAARAAARYAARYAAWYVARDAAWYAAMASARVAAWYVARDAAMAAAMAATRYAARYAENEWQCQHLAEMLEEVE